MKSPEDAREPLRQTGELWLGYAGLVVSFEHISALLVYQAIWDRRIVQSYGRLPTGIRSVVLLSDGRVLPSSRALEDLHARWIGWQHAEQVAADIPERDEPEMDEGE